MLNNHLFKMRVSLSKLKKLKCLLTSLRNSKIHTQESSYLSLHEGRIQECKWWRKNAKALLIIYYTIAMRRQQQALSLSKHTHKT
jgi:hypothetical protein